VALLPASVTTFLNFDTSLPAEQGSLVFLLDGMEASNGREFRNFDFRSSDVEAQVPEHATTCFTYMREGGYLQARLANLVNPENSLGGPDTEFNRKMQEIASRLHRSGWNTIVSKYYPGRISFQLAFFKKQTLSAGARSSEGS
jgi:hypothetical protein